jgi:hypothetical protein
MAALETAQPAPADIPAAEVVEPSDQVQLPAALAAQRLLALAGIQSDHRSDMGYSQVHGLIVAAIEEGRNTSDQI